MPLARLLLVLVLLVASAGAGAQEASQATPDLTASSAQLSEVGKEIANIRDALPEASDNDEALARRRVELEAIASRLLAFGVSFRPALATINKRLGELGAPPGDDAPPEAGVVAAERAELQARKKQINALLGQAEDLSIAVTEAGNSVSAMRRELFARTLLRRTSIERVFNAENSALVSRQLETAARAVNSRLQFVWTFRRNELLIASVLSLGLASLAWVLVRLLLRPILRVARGGSRMTTFGRLVFAFSDTLGTSLAVALALGVTYGLFSFFNIFQGHSLAIFETLLIALAALVFVTKLATAVFAPLDPGRRLMPLRRSAALALTIITVVMALANLTDYVLGSINELIPAPLSVTVSQSFTASMVVGLLLIPIALVHPFRDRQTRRPKAWPVYVRAPLLALAAFVIGSALAGYVGLARFAAGQIVFTGAILFTMLLGARAAHAIFSGGIADTGLGRRLKEKRGWSDGRVDRLGLVAGVALYATVLLAGLPLLALQWGFSAIEVRAMLWQGLTDITIGRVSISLLALLFGVLVFLVGAWLTRRFQGWLDAQVLVRSRVDSGVRNSIAAVVGYVGFAVAALVGVSAAGFDLTSLAFVAGALSLGIGFGLQNIVNNFVSGLILLVERPFKVGDWISTGSTVGFVRKISVRATEVETFQRQTVILPNSDLINNPLSNWTHRSHLGRVDIPVGVAYGVKPRVVHDLLMRIAEADPSVLKVPPPFVAFQGFGDSALNFELRVHIANVLDTLVVASRIRFTIVEAFESEGIAIPFPQRDVNLKFDEIERAASAFAQARQLRDAEAAGDIQSTFSKDASLIPRQAV